MHWIVPAAGRGSRLTPYTDTKPKWLVEMNGVSLCDRLLAVMEQLRHQKLSIVTGYRSENFYNKFRGKDNIELIQNDEWHQTNVVHSLSLAKNALSSGNCIISYSDIFYSAVAVEQLCKSTADIAICYDPDPIPVWSLRYDEPLADLETFKIGISKNLLEIGKKPTKESQVGGQFMGLIKITPAGWDQLLKVKSQLPEADQKELDVTTLLSMAIDAEVEVKGVVNPDPWGEIDTPQDLDLYSKLERERSDYA